MGYYDRFLFEYKAMPSINYCWFAVKALGLKTDYEVSLLDCVF